MTYSRRVTAVLDDGGVTLKARRGDSLTYIRILGARAGRYSLELSMIVARRRRHGLGTREISRGLSQMSPVIFVCLLSWCVSPA